MREHNPDKREATAREQVQYWSQSLGISSELAEFLNDEAEARRIYRIETNSARAAMKEAANTISYVAEDMTTEIVHALKTIDQDAENTSGLNELAISFRKDGFLSGEVHKALITPTARSTVNQDCFRFAVLIAVTAARPYVDPIVFAGPGPLRVIGDWAKKAEGKFYRPVSQNTLEFLEDLLTLSKGLPKLAQALGDRKHLGFSIVINACAIRAKALFDQTIQEKNAEMNAAHAAVPEFLRKLTI